MSLEYQWRIKLSILMLPFEVDMLRADIEKARVKVMKNPYDNDLVYLLGRLYDSPMCPLLAVGMSEGKPSFMRLESWEVLSGPIPQRCYNRIKEAFEGRIKDDWVLAAALTGEDTIATLPGIHVVNPANHFDLLAAPVYA